MRLFSFDIRAKTYSTFSQAQSFFAKTLASAVKMQWGGDFNQVIDLGCGNGEVARAMYKEGIIFKHYIGCDVSQSMLQYFHVKSLQAQLVCQDFDSFLSCGGFGADLIVSNSALQWARDLQTTLELLSAKQTKMALFIPTAGSFKSLHQFLNTNSPLKSVQDVEKLLLSFFQGRIERLEYLLSFAQPQEMINHLRGSGVMGGGNLSYQQAKKLLEYEGVLEYEGILFLGEVKERIKK